MSFDSWYKNVKFSDTKVCLKVYKESGTAPKNARRRRRYFKPESNSQHMEVVEEFPAHKVVLGRASKYFEAQLERQAAQADVLVAENEVAAAQHLFQYIYSEKVPEGLDSTEMMKLLKLSDQFQVLGCSKQVVELLVAFEDGSWNLDLLQSLTHLVENLSEVEITASLHQRATYLVRGKLQDFEAAWRSEAVRSFFCQLPQIFVENLLVWDALTVYSENVVATALHFWLDAQPLAVQPHAAADLVPLLRVPHCTPSYVASILPNLHTLSGCESLAVKIADATALQMVPEEVRAEFIGRLPDHDKSSWTPRSKLPVLPYTFSTQFTFKQISQIQRKLLEDGKEEEMLSGKPHWLNGLQFMLNVTVRAASNSQYGVLWAGVGFKLDNAENPAMFTRFVFELKLAGEEKPLLANAFANITANRSWGVNLFADLPQQPTDKPLTFVVVVKHMY